MNKNDKDYFLFWGVDATEALSVPAEKVTHHTCDPYKYLGDASDIPVNPLSTQEGGNHYKKYKIQPVEFAMANNLDLCQANVVKYTVRFRDKGGKEDLLKARHFIDLLLQFEYGEK